jgi:diguanylate cyclase
MSSSEIEKSFQTLKQTVPLMLKHKISAIPTNYALWYTYVTNESEQLNQEIDRNLSLGHPPSAVKTQELYRNYLSEKQEVSAWQLRQSMEAMLIEVSHSMKDTRSDTAEFKTVMDRSLDNLSKVEKEGLSVQEVMNLVRSMVKEVQIIRQSTISFSGALTNADKEIQQLKAKLQQSQHDALYDALTGLCNRRFFDSELESKLNLDTLSLALVDIDHFKKLNDEHGHVMGDMVLKAIAKKLQNSCRNNAQVFRYGGEEFAVLMPETNQQSARHMADVMRRAIEKVTVKDRRTGATLGGITVSIGVAQRQTDDEATSLLERADDLLYQAKTLGRNRVMPIA